MSLLSHGGPSSASPNTNEGQHTMDATLQKKQKLNLGMDERHEEFERLIRHYMVQIHYGCTNTNCTTPTCFSCHRRIITAPVRRPTILTARTLALLLASEEDPHAGLCRNRLLASTDDVDPFEKTGRDLVKSETAKDGINGTSGNHAIAIGEIDQAVVTPGKPSKTAILTPTKDRRSLTQNIFHTRAAKSIGWGISGSPLDMLQRLAIFANPKGGDKQYDSKDRNGHVLPNAMNTRKTAAHTNGINEDLEFHNSQKLANTTIKVRMRSRSAEESSSSEPAERNTPKSLPTTTPPYLRSSLSRLEMAGLRHIMWQASVRSDSKNALEIYHDHAVRHRLIATYNACPAITQILPGFLSKMKNEELILFIRRTISYHFQDASRLLCCFRASVTEITRNRAEKQVAPLQRFEDQTIGPQLPDPGPVGLDLNPFQCWKPFIGPLLLDSIWHSLEALFTPPPHITVAKSPRLKPQMRTKNGDHEYISDNDAAHLVAIAIFTLAGSVEGNLVVSTLNNVRNWRAWGRTLANSRQSGAPDALADPWLHLSDGLEYEPAVRLANRLVRAIAARRSFWLVSRAMQGLTVSSNEEKFPLMERVMGILKEHMNTLNTPDDIVSNAVFFFVEFLRTVMIKSWRGTTIVTRWEGFGAAMEIMGDLYPRRRLLYLTDHAFYLPFLSEHLTEEQITTALVSSDHPDNNTLSLFSFPFLFLPSVLVRYFRVISYTKMTEAYNSASYHRKLIDRLSWATDQGRFEDDSLYGNRRWDRRAFLEEKLKPALRRYLVLDVRRDHLLEDTFDQLWGREKRELLRPLKVRMGMDEGGEEGVDHGGVSQEFFRVVFEKAFDPDAGLFVTDPRTRMSWFQPLSMEPLQTYELLGLLISLAIYNGVTLPVTFPLALYQRLLAIPGEDARVWIEDGWPELAKGFREMLSWTEGDVSDVFVREYAFDFKANGQRHAIDMLALGRDGEWPPTPSVDSGAIPLVTNSNREQYVSDYIYYLTHKSISPQFSAFAKGFHTCIDSSALSLLSPALLRTLAEGSAAVDLEGLKGTTRYEDGYSKDHPSIKDFWSVVSEYEEEKRRRLLEFVTASDRVPVQGWTGVVFCIVRNGGDCDRLPTSMTCFGKLLLPEYESKEKMKEKLHVALENSKGFGTM